MSSKFHSIYRQYINEADGPILGQPIAGDVDAPVTPDAPPPPNVPTIDNQEPEAETALDTNGFVTLVRLLKDAFVIKPTTEDAEGIIELGDINPDNVQEKFKTIINLIKKYNPKTDINTDGLISQL